MRAIHHTTARERILCGGSPHRIPYAGSNQIRFEGLVVLIPPLSYSLPLRWCYAFVAYRRATIAASVRSHHSLHGDVMQRPEFTHLECYRMLDGSLI